MRSLYIIICLFPIFAFSQELSCRVSVNTNKVNQTSQRVFKTLEKSLNEFVNQTKWTNIEVLPNEKIDCAMNFVVTSYENNEFVVDLQIQSSRPVYGTTYQTNILNYQEKSVKFSYLENEPLFFNENVYSSNLSSIVSYYVYMILGFDADTFSKKGGENHFKKAMSIVLNAQTSSDVAWSSSTGKDNRWQLVNDLLSIDFEQFRGIMYSYHKTLDTFLSDKNSKENLKNILISFENIKTSRFNNFLIQLFFNAKADEIAQIFSQTENINIVPLKNSLQKTAPLLSEKWKNLK